MSDELVEELNDGERFVGAIVVTLIRKEGEETWRYAVNAIADEIPGDPLDLELLVALRSRIEKRLLIE